MAVGLNERNITQAVSVLKQYVEKKGRGEKKPANNLLEDPENEEIHLHISLKKIPKLQNLQYHKIKLPHPFMVDMKDVCLFTSDLDKKAPDDERTQAHFTELLRSVGMSVGQIIPYHQLKTEYKTFESRRMLARSYQTFLNDGKISRMMPVTLGTFFVRKKKMPIAVCLTPDKVKAELLRALARTTLTLTGRGSSCGVKVGTLNQSVGELSENISAVVSYLERDLPGKWPNVLSIYVKTTFSMAIPVYTSLESSNEVEEPSDCRNDEAVVDELSTLTSSKVKVFPSGKVRLIKTEADEVPNENANLEKKMLSNQRYYKNKKKLKQIKKKFLRESREKSKKKDKKAAPLDKRNKGTKAAEKEAPDVQSPFGLLRSGINTREGLLRKRKKYLDRKEFLDNDSVDRSFEDSFSLQKRSGSAKEDSKTAVRFELKPIQVQQTAEPDASLVQGTRLRLQSKKRSYSMMTKSQSNAENVNTELLSFVRKDDIDALEKKAEKPKRTEAKQEKGKKSFKNKPGKGSSNKSQVMDESKKKLSRVQSIRQSVRLAKTLM